MTDQIPDYSQFETDELDASIEAAMVERPGLVAALEDAQALKVLLDELVRLRKQADLTQTDIAKLMGVRQPTVSQFETESSDPRISTLQRYARAVGGRVCWQILSPYGVYSPRQTYKAYTEKPSSAAASAGPRHVKVVKKSLPADWSAALARSRRRFGYDEAA